MADPQATLRALVAGASGQAWADAIIAVALSLVPPVDPNDPATIVRDIVRAGFRVVPVADDDVLLLGRGLPSSRHVDRLEANRAAVNAYLRTQESE